MPRGGVIRNRGRAGKGALTDDQVREIRGRQVVYKYAIDNCSPMAISKEMGVSVHSVRDIFQGRMYTHVY